MTHAPVTLAYANPRGGQPLGSRFDVQPLPDGVRVTRPTPPNRFMAIAVGMVGVWGVAGAIVAALSVAHGASHRDGQEALVGCAAMVVTALIATAMIAHARTLARHRVLSIVARRDEVVVTHGRSAGWRVTAPLRFTTPTGGYTVRGGRIAHVNLRGRGQFIERSVATNLPRDEAVWLARVLSDAAAAPG